MSTYDEQRFAGGIEPQLAANAALYLAGELREERAVELEVLLRRVVDDSPPGNLVVDVTSVFGTCAQTLTALGRLAHELQATDRQLVITNPTPAICRAVCFGASALDDGRRWEPVDHTDEQISPALASSMVQQLFSVGLSLAGVQSRLVDEPAKSRVASALDQIDAVVREIRTAAFAWRPGGAPSDLRVELRISSTGPAELRLIGQLHAAGATYVDQLLAALDGCSVEVEVSELHSIDSSGVATLSQRDTAFDGAGPPIIVRGACGAVWDALALAVQLAAGSATSGRVRQVAERLSN